MLILIRGYWTYHIHKLELTFNKLKGKRLKYSIGKSFFGQTKMEYLGLRVTRDGFKTIYRKTEAITNMAPRNY